MIVHYTVICAFFIYECASDVKNVDEKKVAG